jgi:mono/diheme cytochrome c family protein
MYKNASITCTLLLALCFFINGPLAAATPNAGALFATHCAHCHGADRLGAMGPALLPENLQRTKRDAAAKIITAGRSATQMPAFKETLKPEEIAALVEYIYTAPATPPVWGDQGKPGGVPARIGRG